MWILTYPIYGGPPGSDFLTVYLLDFSIVTFKYYTMILCNSTCAMGEMC